MSLTKFVLLASIVIVSGLLFTFFKILPPSVIFNHPTAKTLPGNAQSLITPTPPTKLISLPPPVKISNAWSNQNIPDQKISFDFPNAWGSPSASLTHFSTPGSGTLTGIYFIDNQLGDTPVFLEITSPDYKNTATTNTLFSQTRSGITAAIESDGTNYAYYTYAQLPNHIKVYVYLPDIQNNLPEDTGKFTEYYDQTFPKIFSGIGLSATDSANLRDFQKLIKSIKYL